MNFIGAQILFYIIILSLLPFWNGCTALGAISISPEELKLKYGTQEDEYLDVDGLQVRYRDEGEGPVIIMLHGVCSSLETWDKWTKILKDQYRIIRLDIPGFGLTGPAPDKRLYTIDHAVEFLNRFANQLDLEKFNLVGNSLGGYISWNYSLRYPHKVEKMILIDSVGYAQDMPGMLRFASNPIIRPTSRHMMPRRFLDKSVEQAYGDKSKATLEVKQRYFDFAMREGNKQAYIDVFVELRRKSHEESLSKGISNIEVPVLVMWGTKDEWIPIDHLERYRKDLRSARYVVYEGAGHIPMEEIPEKTSRDAIEFLR